MSKSRVRIYKSSQVELDKLSYSKIYRTSNGTFKSLVQYDKKNSLLVRSPTMYLGADVVKCGDDYFIDLAFNTKSKLNREFLELVKGIDFLNISEVYENSTGWFPDQDAVSLCQIESEYIQSTKLSTLHNDRPSMKVKVNSKKVEFYDQGGVEVPYQLLKEGYPTVALLQLNHVYRENQHIWADWSIAQLKVTVPDNIFTECQLVDVVDESDIEEDEIPGDEEFY